VQLFPVRTGAAATDFPPGPARPAPAPDATGRAGFVPCAPVKSASTSPCLNSWTALWRSPSCGGGLPRDARRLAAGRAPLRGRRATPAPPLPHTKNAGTRTVPVPDKAAAVVLAARPRRAYCYVPAAAAAGPTANFTGRMLRPAVTRPST
jgi:hypothetical protein